jgi:hypothetical protein
MVRGVGDQHLAISYYTPSCLRYTCPPNNNRACTSSEEALRRARKQSCVIRGSGGVAWSLSLERLNASKQHFSSPSFPSSVVFATCCTCDCLSSQRTLNGCGLKLWGYSACFRSAHEDMSTTNMEHSSLVGSISAAENLKRLAARDSPVMVSWISLHRRTSLTRDQMDCIQCLWTRHAVTSALHSRKCDEPPKLATKNRC